MTYQRHEAEVPTDLVSPTHGVTAPDGHTTTVTFDWRPGTPASGLSGPPENYDPGEPDEFVVLTPDTSCEGEDCVIEWLDANWERPDDGPDPDDLRDRMIDDRLTGDA